ncbi:MAG: glycosyltransferase family 4 protein [Verrucomicrobiota bacterium]
MRNSCHVVFDAEAATGQSAQPSYFSISACQNVSFSSPLLSPNSNLPSSVIARPAASFAGFLNQSEIPKAYVAADCVALPSVSETWGLAVNEGMACGLPAVVSDAVGCSPDLIEEGKTGFTYPVGDTAQFAQRLTAVWEMKERRLDYGPALAEKLLTYSVGSALGGTLKAMESLIVREAK